MSDKPAISLEHHAVIEASAGTGKTYTIEQIVLRLIKKGVPLESLLTVTFTEKAAGELMERIRNSLLKEQDTAEGEEKASVVRALQSYDRASVFTIHGFCHHVLQLYAFENGETFRYEIEDDLIGYNHILQRQMREEWPLCWGEHLGLILSLIGYPDYDAREERSRLEGLLVSVALEYRGDYGDRFLPDCREDDPAILLELVREGWKCVRQLAGPVDAEEPSMSELCRRYERLNFPKNSRDAHLKNYLIPLMEVLGSEEDDWRKDYLAFMSRVSGEDKYKKTRSFRFLSDVKWNAKSGPNPEVCPEISGLVEALDRVVENARRLKYGFLQRAVLDLQREAEAEKRRRGGMSYNDMLCRVDRALDPQTSRGRHLLRRLRERYSYALIDEFQDTDAVQWNIFRKLFLEEEQRLFIIGDPKQSIYRFRGADVHTYLKAREEFRRLASRGKASMVELGVNWRSLPGLIQVQNRLFGSGWFGDSGIGYSPVQAPEEDKRITRIHKNHAGRGSLLIVDITSSSSSSEAKRVFARFTAQECRRLLDSPPVISFKGETRPLRRDDICILVRGKNEAPLLERYLREEGVPCTFYKKPGVYESGEALHLLYFLRGIEKPSDTGAFRASLLTRFFGIPLKELQKYDLTPPEHPVRRLYDKWIDLAARGRWTVFFQSILEDSGLMFREALQHDGERRITNFLQITQHLEEAALREEMELRDILALLRSYRRGEAELPEDGDLHRIETEERRVQIMTIHASKGLEFPVVFLAGGFTENTRPPVCHVYHREEGKVFDFGGDEEAQRQWHREIDEEDRRLYYVALTRASCKLYLPRLEPSGGTKEEGRNKTRRGAGPVTRFLYNSLEASWPDCRGEGDVQFLDPDGNPLSPQQPPLLPCDPLPDSMAAENTAEDSILLTDPLFPVVDSAVGQRRVNLYSYSSLKKRGRSRAESYFRPELNSPDEDEYPGEEREPASLIDESAGNLAASPLPPTRETGLALHEILEETDFALFDQGSPQAMLRDGEVCDPDLRELIRFKIEKYSLREQSAARGLVRGDALEGEIVRILWTVLNAPLPGLEEEGDLFPFRFSRLTQGDRLSELEFYYPAGTGDENLPGVEGPLPEGFIKGKIDLVFRYRGKIYLADWKSDTLKGGYDSAALHEVTRERYGVQEILYARALKKWLLQIAGDRRKAEAMFGGVYYLYLRGMEIGQPGRGIYFSRGGE